MAHYKKGKKYYIKGKLLREDGTYYNYNKLARGCTKGAEAKTFEIEFIKHFQDINYSTDKPTFEELANEYILQCTNVKTSTIISKKELLRRVSDEVKCIKVNLAKKKTLQDFISKLEETLSEAYVKRIYYFLSQVFDYAIERGIITVNPMKNVRRFIDKDKVRGLPEFWEPSEFKLFIDNVSFDPDPIFHAYFNFLYFMGVRRGEAAALTWEDIDLDSNVVRIFKTASFKVRPVAITSPKTKNSLRNISMPKQLLEIMRVYKEWCTKKMGYNEKWFVFGLLKPLDPETTRRKLKYYIQCTNHDLEAETKEIKLSNIHIHSFRHSHASFLINNMKDNFTDYDIANRLGDTIETLHDTYAHWFQDAEKPMLDAFENW